MKFLERQLIYVDVQFCVRWVLKLWLTCVLLKIIYLICCPCNVVSMLVQIDLSFSLLWIFYKCLLLLEICEGNGHYKVNDFLCPLMTLQYLRKWFLLKNNLVRGHGVIPLNGNLTLSWITLTEQEVLKLWTKKRNIQSLNNSRLSSVSFKHWPSIFITLWGEKKFVINKKYICTEIGQDLFKYYLFLKVCVDVIISEEHNVKINCCLRLLGLMLCCLHKIWSSALVSNESCSSMVWFLISSNLKRN